MGSPPAGGLAAERPCGVSSQPVLRVRGSLSRPAPSRAHEPRALGRPGDGRCRCPFPGPARTPGRPCAGDRLWRHLSGERSPSRSEWILVLGHRHSGGVVQPVSPRGARGRSVSSAAVHLLHAIFPVAPAVGRWCFSPFEFTSLRRFCAAPTTWPGRELVPGCPGFVRRLPGARAGAPEAAGALLAPPRQAGPPLRSDARVCAGGRPRKGGPDSRQCVMLPFGGGNYFLKES